jgi:F-type H+-transporting ATPase subunit gamma
MAKTREIKKRIRSIESTRKITRTMELVATSKMKRAQDRVLASRPYSSKLREVLASLAASVGGAEMSHPLLREPDRVRRVDVLLACSNRGLCGAYNTNVIGEAYRLYRDLVEKGRTVRLHVSGKKGQSFFRFREIPLESTFTEPSDRPGFHHAQSLGERFMREFTGEGTPGGEPTTDRVVLVYTRFVSAGVMRPVAEDLLPMRAEEMTGGGGGDRAARGQVIFEPDGKEILEFLLPLYVKMRVYEALLNAQASEHSARMIAMKMATDNAGELITSLTRAYNKQRQAQITQELAEIMGGVEALKG